MQHQIWLSTLIICFSIWYSYVKSEDLDSLVDKRRGWGKRSFIDTADQDLYEDENLHKQENEDALVRKRRVFGKNSFETEKRRGWGKRSPALVPDLYDTMYDLAKRRGWGKRATWGNTVESLAAIKRRGWGKRGANTLDDPRVIDALAADTDDMEELFLDEAHKRRGWGKRSSMDGESEYYQQEKRRGWGKRNAESTKRRGWGKRNGESTNLICDKIQKESLYLHYITQVSPEVYEKIVRDCSLGFA